MKGTYIYGRQKIKKPLNDEINFVVDLTEEEEDTYYKVLEDSTLIGKLLKY